MDSSSPQEEDTPMPPPPPSTKRKPDRGREVVSKLIKTPPFAYACLELTARSTTAARRPLDDITVRTYVNQALTQFLGLSGAAISVDILKVEAGECWLRVPREDLAPFLAGVGGWVGEGGTVGWRVRGSGLWLSALIAERESERLWND